VKKKKAPAKVKWTNVQYGRGAHRSVNVALRTITQLNMNKEEILSFLKTYSEMMQKELSRVNGKWNLRNPFVDKATNDALLTLSKQKYHKDN